MLARLTIAALFALSGLQAAAADVLPSEYLDERTGSTITVVHEPLVFALEHSILAANARDYISLTAVQVDHSGRLEMYLIGYFWSTIDRRHNDAKTGLARAPLELSADGRLIRLVPTAQFPDDFLDQQKLLAPKTSHLERAAYPVSSELLRYIAASKHLSLDVAIDFPDADPDSVAAPDDEREIYQVWSEGKKSLEAFVKHAGNE